MVIDITDAKKGVRPRYPDGEVVEVVRRLPEGLQLVKVHYNWPCFNCRTLFEVDWKTHQLLKMGTLTGIKCPNCLLPPTNTGLVAA